MPWRRRSARLNSWCIMPKKKPSPHGDPDGIYPPRKPPDPPLVALGMRQRERQDHRLDRMLRFIDAALQRIAVAARKPAKAAALKGLMGADPLDPEIQADAKELARLLTAVKDGIATLDDLTKPQLFRLLADSLDLGKAWERLSVRGFEEDVVVRRKAKRGRSDATTKKNLEKSKALAVPKSDWQGLVLETMEKKGLKYYPATEQVAANLGFTDGRVIRDATVNPAPRRRKNSQ